MSVDYTKDANCIGAWTFYEGTGATVGDVASTNNGTITGASWSLTVPNIYSANSLSFDGVNDKVDFGDVTIFDGLAQFTAVAWVWVDALPASGASISILRKDLSCTPLQLNNTSGVHYIRNPLWTGGVLKINKLAYTVPTGEWFHYAVVWDKDVNSGKSKFYINGADVGDGDTGCAGVLTDSAKVLIFGLTESSTEDFAGDLTEVAFFSRTLSSTEIGEIKDNGIRGARIFLSANKGII